MPCRHLSASCQGATSGNSLSLFDHRTAWYRLIPVGIGYQAKNLHWQSVYSKPTTGQPPFLAQAEATGRRSRNLPIIFHKWYYVWLSLQVFHHGFGAGVDMEFF